jgi:hypothetical protein
VHCPSGCASTSNASVYGCENSFSLASSVCRAAIHAGMDSVHQSQK